MSTGIHEITEPRDGAICMVCGFKAHHQVNGVDYCTTHGNAYLEKFLGARVLTAPEAKPKYAVLAKQGRSGGTRLVERLNNLEQAKVTANSHARQNRCSTEVIETATRKVVYRADLVRR